MSSVGGRGRDHVGGKSDLLDSITVGTQGRVLGFSMQVIAHRSSSKGVPCGIPTEVLAREKTNQDVLACR
eukprot:9402445-Ditylum_brightwellii.AAC.1